MDIFLGAKNASREFSSVGSNKKDELLMKISELIDKQRKFILTENAKDIDYAVKNSLKESLLDRLLLNEKRIDSMINGVMEIQKQDDPVGSIEMGTTRPNGLIIEKIRVPLGVVGIIYESRPNVTVDAAALCIKSGNVCILRGGKEAVHSNLALGKIIKDAIISANLNEYIVNVVEDPNREFLNKMLKAKGFVDLIIPRGGESLISYVTEHSLIPVIKHDKGVCHVYIDNFALKDMAINIALNAKVSRPGVCNAMETLLVHHAVANEFLTEMVEIYHNNSVELVGCKRAQKFNHVKPATEDDWYTEYLSLKLSIKVVDSLYEAIDHINKYGSGHSEAIVTENYSNAMEFLKRVDAAAVYVNASTRFTDGGEFGLGAEVGISTQKLHCRGPMGVKDLTTTKYIIFGNGQVRV
ncbi:MAG: glutamate-5-semialdehyde dehydrogenase [Calditerrivibrio sp.]|nr:glutamate-5-semialdehyde dehydrogenase [Calditerrivibrio sp.]MCA1933174.1 glutamate-5-semialdehyde dehydrogenase [Calditerrivibrio sp.]MCA1980113.1 glutamate-5-semialdehyde dehydrogenase [Calditerrivibrio sp.]